MTGLAARLVEALDRAEQTARSIKLGCDWYTPDDLTRSHRDGGAGLADFDADHIATWSPERMLRLIARDRALLADHIRQEPGNPQSLIDELRTGWCRRCMPDDVPGATLYTPWPCETVRLVAAFWLPADRDPMPDVAMSSTSQHDLSQVTGG